MECQLVLFLCSFPLVSLSLPPQLIQQYSCPVVSYCLIMYFAEQSFKNETIKLEGEGGEQDNQMCRERGGNKGQFERGVRELGFAWG